MLVVLHVGLLLLLAAAALPLLDPPKDDLRFLRSFRRDPWTLPAPMLPAMLPMLPPERTWNPPDAPVAAAAAFFSGVGE